MEMAHDNPRLSDMGTNYLCVTFRLELQFEYTTRTRVRELLEFLPPLYLS